MSELFNEEVEIRLPESTKEENYEELITQGVAEAITKDEIKPVLINSSVDIEIPSYLLDMSEVSNVTLESIDAIAGMLTGGNVTVYMKYNTSIMRVGYGDEQKLYSVLGSVVKHMYNGKCDLYINRGDGFERTREIEVNAVRLDL